MSARHEDYYLIRNAFSEADGMMLGNMPELPDDMEDDWMFGTPFSIEPEQPIYIGIPEGEEKCKPLSFYQSLPIASQHFIDALEQFGVGNIITYDVVLKSRINPSFVIEGYKAINIIGLKSITEKHNLMLFRLADNMRIILVHKTLKRHLESKNFTGLVFTQFSNAKIL